MSDVLVKTATATAMVSREALAWVSDAENVENVGSEKKSVEKALRQLTLESERIGEAAEKNMCVSVFGPSQAGKSYLVSVLAKKDEKPLTACFGDGSELDFVVKINPDGDKESTGLVTRFSVREQQVAPGYAISVELLSEADIVRIIVNSYFLDGDPSDAKPIERDDLLAALEKAQSQAQSSQPADNQLRIEDIWEIQDYCDEQFPNNSQLDALTPLWEMLPDHAGKLNIAARAELFSLLWGQLEQFTQLYIRLTSALAQLKFPARASLKMDALVPKSTSIIDVQTLTGIGSEGSETLTICADNGTEAVLERSTIAALVAELNIQMKDKPWGFFDVTDLLDFPGARERQKTPLKRFLEDESKSDPVKELLIRAKVAYLFDRYVQRQELTSMLLCIPESNQDVVSLPAMVSRWIDISHGASPEARVGIDVVLFLLLTKFDMHFATKAGEAESDPGTRFASRLHASIRSFLARVHQWPDKWTPDTPFKNTYWLRNPAIQATNMYTYDEQGRETGHTERFEKTVDELREGYLGVEDVSKFFAEPQRAFDEAIKLNDGGVSYLAENLAKVCTPQLKRKQLMHRLINLRKAMSEKLGHFYTDSDVEKRLHINRAAADELMQALYPTLQEGRFGAFLRELQAGQAHIMEAVVTAFNTPSSDYSKTSMGGAQAATQLRSVPPMPGRVVPPAPGNTPNPSSAKLEDAPAKQSLMSLEDRLIQAAFERWESDLFAKCGSDQFTKTYGLTSEIASKMADQIVSAARRCKLSTTVAEQMKTMSAGANEASDSTQERAAFLAINRINSFVNSFNFDKVDEKDRPEAPMPDGTMEPVFKPRVLQNSINTLPVEKLDFAYILQSRWMYVFYRAAEDNATFVDNGKVNMKQNLKLGEILQSLSDDTSG